MTIYIVTMYRWGDRYKHSYVLGAYGTEEKSRKAALQEEIDRGGNKYAAEILEVKLNSSSLDLQVQTLPLAKTHGNVIGEGKR
jgi:hypothetical protein